MKIILLLAAQQGFTLVDNPGKISRVCSFLLGLFLVFPLYLIDYFQQRSYFSDQYVNRDSIYDCFN